MKFFQDLGRDIHRAWGERRFERLAFPDVAVGVLTQVNPAAHVDVAEVLDWVATADTLPVQDYRQKFADLNLVVYRGQRFFIEVLFWADGTTAIHQHSFSGAFSSRSRATAVIRSSLRVMAVMSGEGASMAASARVAFVWTGAGTSLPAAGRPPFLRAPVLA